MLSVVLRFMLRFMLRFIVYAERLVLRRLLCWTSLRWMSSLQVLLSWMSLRSALSPYNLY